MTDEWLILLIGSLGGMVLKNTIDLAVLCVRFNEHIKDEVKED